MNVLSVDNKIARQVSMIIEEFRKLDKEMQAQQMLIYLTIMSSPGITQREIEQKLDLESSSVSRNVAALGAVTRKGKEGHNLIVTKEDPNDRRYKVVHPTAKGKSVFNTILHIMTR